MLVVLEVFTKFHKVLFEPVLLVIIHNLIIKASGRTYMTEKLNSFSEQSFGKKPTRNQ
jgi:hypothetical protein